MIASLAVLFNDSSIATTGSRIRAFLLSRKWCKICHCQSHSHAADQHLLVLVPVTMIPYQYICRKELHRKSYHVHWCFADSSYRNISDINIIIFIILCHHHSVSVLVVVAVYAVQYILLLPVPLQMGHCSSLCKIYFMFSIGRWLMCKTLSLCCNTL